MCLFSVPSSVLYFLSVFSTGLSVFVLVALYLFSSRFWFCFPSFVLSLILCTSYTKHTLYKSNSHLGLPNKCHVLEALRLTYFSCCSVSMSHSGPLLEIPPPSARNPISCRSSYKLRLYLQVYRKGAMLNCKLIVL